MRFPGFYGNDALKTRLSLSAKKLSHCYILEGPAGSGKRTLARLLAAAMECQGEGEIPCGTCPACHKALGSGHPDIITVDSDTATVPIRLIREMQTDAFVMPNEGKRKVYILPRAQDLQIPAQNALLKLLEEPPEYCAFLLLTDSMEKLLETVRSRAVVLTLAPLDRETLHRALKERQPEADPEALARAMDRSEGYLGAALEALDSPETELEKKAMAVLTGLASGDELQLLEALLPLEKLKRPEMLELLTILSRSLTRVMDPGSRNAQGAKVLARCSRPQLFTAAEAIHYTITLVQSNGSSGHAVGALMARLRSFS